MLPRVRTPSLRPAGLLLAAIVVLGLWGPSALSAHGVAPAGAAAGELSLITEPGAGDRPFLAAIRGARSSVELVMYELEDPAVEQALVAAAHRGVAVRVLLNGGYYGEGSAANRPAYTYLKAHGVAVRWSPARFALTHQKTLIVDGRVAYVMTLNLVTEDYAGTRDFAVADTHPADVAAITTTFDADWANRAITPPQGSDLVWSPGALDPTLSLIDAAHHRLEIYNEEMDDAAVTGALEAAARRGVRVEVVMTADSEWDAAFRALSAAGVHVRTFAADASLYIHAKMILADGTRALLGSQNFSAGSLEDNRELGLVLSTPAILRSLAATFAGDFAHASPFRAPAAAAHASCTVSASWNARYDDWDVDVRGPADVEATASADGHHGSYETDSSGFADIYLYAPHSAAGDPLTATAGSATCHASL